MPTVNRWPGPGDLHVLWWLTAQPTRGARTPTRKCRITWQFDWFYLLYYFFKSVKKQLKIYISESTLTLKHLHLPKNVCSTVAGGCSTAIVFPANVRNQGCPKNGKPLPPPTLLKNKNIQFCEKRGAENPFKLCYRQLQDCGICGQCFIYSLQSLAFLRDYGFWQIPLLKKKPSKTKMLNLNIPPQGKWSAMMHTFYFKCHSQKHKYFGVFVLIQFLTAIIWTVLLLLKQGRGHSNIQSGIKRSNENVIPT